VHVRDMFKVIGPPGLLVAIEGIDGAGKSTQVKRLATALDADGYGTVRTFEPTNGVWGSKLRQSASTGRLSPRDEFETFVKDRREHVENLIKPSLAAGKIVLIDRYYFSSMAYQGARGIDPEEIQRENEAFAPRPDLLVILEIAPRGGVTRVNARGKGDLFEREDDLARAAAIFASIRTPAPLRIDASQPLDRVTVQVLRAVRDVIAKR
jgi:dTMP kinase